MSALSLCRASPAQPHVIAFLQLCFYRLAMLTSVLGGRYLNRFSVEQVVTPKGYPVGKQQRLPPLRKESSRLLALIFVLLSPNCHFCGFQFQLHDRDCGSGSSRLFKNCNYCIPQVPWVLISGQLQRFRNSRRTSVLHALSHDRRVECRRFFGPDPSSSFVT